MYKAKRHKKYGYDIWFLSLVYVIGASVSKPNTCTSRYVQTSSQVIITEFSSYTQHMMHLFNHLASLLALFCVPLALRSYRGTANNVKTL